MRILAVCGSLQSKSKNLTLLGTAARHVPRDAVPGPDRGRRGLQALCDTLSAVRVAIVAREPIPIGTTFERLVAALVERLIQAVTKRNINGSTM